MIVAISKRYSRRITADGVVYRWLIGHRPTSGEFDYAGAMVAAVQLADEPGGILFVNCGLRAGNILGVTGAVVTPRGIATAIRAALVGGWKPREVGVPFRISLPTETEDS